MQTIRGRVVPWMGAVAATLVLGTVLASTSAAAQDAGEPSGQITVGHSNKNDVSPPLREIPVPPLLLQRPKLKHEKVFSLSDGMAEPDPVVQDFLAPAAMPAPILNFDGIPFPGVACNCAPPDTNGEVGDTQYVQMVNEGLQVFNKATGASVLGPVGISTLWAGFGGVCETSGFGDPIVVYDQLANRWVVSQFAGASIPTNHCVAVSQTNDATGAWFRYDFTLGTNFFDYPKMSVWPDAYYLAENVFNAAGTAYLGPQPFALNRAAMLTGAPATFITPGLQPISLGFMLSADLDGSLLPPAGAPNPWLSAFGATWSVYRFHVDWGTPANSTWTLGGNLTPAGFTEICPATRSCVPQLGTTSGLDAIGDRPMFRLVYRRFADNHEALLGNRTVSSSAVAGIRWWEINNATSGTPSFVQESTYQPDTTWRWMGSIAMDTVGNVALGFSASSASINPQIRYAGRLFNDPANTLAQGEATLHAGTGSQSGTGNRWGDYSDMTVDPVDDCTFWYTNEYYSTTTTFNWRTRIGNFKFPNCSLSPTFTLAVTPDPQSICAPANGVYTVNVGSVSGFNSPVTLGATGNPGGTTVGFSANPVTPLPGSSTLTIGNTGAATAGPYTINVTGSAAGPINLNTNVTLNVFTAAAGAPTLLTPANGATNQALSPTFTWSAMPQAATYTLEVATDAAFTSIVHTGSGIATTTYSGATLNSNTVYYWRVRAVNACGNSANSAGFSFSTLALPGDCGIGTTPNILFTENFETGAAGWAHSGTGDTWALSTANPHGGTTSYFAADPATVSDQRLVSPPIAIPAGNPPVVMKFWNWQHMETRTGGCFDGGILEISTDGGTTWAQLGGANLLTDPYDGPISASFSNPLANLNAWCGNNPQPYLNSIVDVTSYAGQTVNFRFRLGSDNSVSRPGWHIDDVAVQNCVPSGPTCPNVDKGDFNNDSKVDLLFDNLTNNRNMVWLMNGATRVGNGSWIAPDAAANQQIVGADDFNGDSQSDLLFWNSSTGVLDFWLMNGATRASSLPITGAPTLATNWKLAATGDFNADTKPDLLWRNTTSQKLVIWTMNGATGTNKFGNIIPTPDQAVDFNWEVVAALDYNNDGNRDLLWYNYSSGKIVLWFMNASVVRITGQFTNPANAGDANWKVYAGGDYGTGSGGTACTNDIVWRNATSGKEVVWYMDFAGNRTFGEFTTPDAPAADPDLNPTPPTDWIVAGPR